MRPLRNLALNLFIAAALLVPAQAQASPATEEALTEILRFMDQAFLVPNGLDYNRMVANEPADVAILLGMALRSQTGHMERDQSLQQPLLDLADEAYNYLYWLAMNTTTQTDPSGNLVTYDLLKEYFRTAAGTTDLDQYVISRYSVDPMPLEHRNVLAVIQAVHALPDGHMLRPIFKDDGPIVLLDRYGTQVAVMDGGGQGVPPGPGPDPTPPVSTGPLMEQDVEGTWVQEGTGLTLVIGRNGNVYEGRFPNAPYQDYGDGHQGAYMNNNWQLANVVLRLESAKRTDWGWEFEGRAHGANGYSENLLLAIAIWDDGRTGLGFDAFVFDMRGFVKR